MVNQFSVRTRTRIDFIDITREISKIVKESKTTDGVCYVFIPHTTASITINENADPDVVSDIKKELEKIVPFDDSYRHSEGNSAAHIKASLLGSSETVIIENGELVLGTWQGIYFCEFDGPRTRKVLVKII
ncbi:MAG: secondary thiamine-phosphate synthase enzyme YjbQ [bacterium]